MVQREGLEKQHTRDWERNRLQQLKEKLKDRIQSWGQKTAVAVQSPSKSTSQFLLFALGITLLILGSGDAADASRQAVYNNDRLNSSINALLLYLEGSFGALVMVCSGIGAILSSAFGQYRAALGLMVVAIGSFILRSLMSTFFNDAGIAE